jgi:eukaryotic-like serine/threonine-protein kinase
MKDEDVTIPLQPSPPARLPLRSESDSLTLHVSDAAASPAATSVTLDHQEARRTLATPGARSRLQKGLVYWALLNALLEFGDMIMTAISTWFERGSTNAPWSSIVVVASLLCTGAAVDRLRLGRRALRTADLIATVASGVGFALMFWTWTDVSLDTRELVFHIATAQLLMTRAAVVPSSGRRSFWLGCLAFLPGVIASFVARTSAGLPWVLPTIQMTYPYMATVVASVLASRRIYGLQRAVNEARRLGPYILVEKVGSGGMGEVFRARHALLRRPTAVKLIRPENATESALLQFEREAQLTSQLTHPSTIQIHDFGRSEGGVIYYAMEFIEGLTLHELVELTGPQPPARVIAILAQICGSLAEAHAVALVHRDVKPANIMLCERGRVADVVKVLDFGLVKLRGQTGNTLDGKDGVIAGTPGFMSPEAITDPNSVDARADIYALGAVGYYMITGHPLFAGTTDAAVLLDQVITPPVPMSLRLGAAVPADLDAVILSCLAKDRQLRPQSAESLCQRLLACHEARGWSQAHAQSWWSVHRDLVQQRMQERRVSISEQVAPSQLHG